MTKYLIILLTIALVACKVDSTSTKTTGEASASTDINIEGTYTELDWDSTTLTHSFSNTEWTSDDDTDGDFSVQDLIRTILEYNNDSNYLIYQNPDTELFNPSLFGKVFWIESTDSNIYICQILYNEESLEAVQANTSEPNFDDPEADSSCGAGTWTNLTFVE